MDLIAEPFLNDLHFGESPRWHEDRLWFSDFYDHGVWAVGEDGEGERITEVEGQPSGLGWLPDGSMLIVSMLDRKLMRFSNGELNDYADLSGVAKFLSNDMVVASSGIAYVGDFGFDLHGTIETKGEAAIYEPPGPPTTSLAIVNTDGSVSSGPSEMFFPNGSVILPDGKTLVV
ncbi:MAG: gluconolactonase, partial [Acidimicrobiales bacterium]|nr:gluconolactonase [Acidimicrobiales bacterium]